MKSLENLQARVILKKDRTKSVYNRHPWIFSGAIDNIEGEFQTGEILSVYSKDRKFLGKGFVNCNSQIRVRLLTFLDEEIHRQFFQQKIIQAINSREKYIDDKVTAYRVIHSEGDFLSGLVVDRYGEILVIQFNSLGMYRLKFLIIELLQELLQPEVIVEKNNPSIVKEEGFSPANQVLYGTLPEIACIQEYDSQYIVDIMEGQKTGFFLDQRENRHLLGTLAANQRVLNCFSYSGGFSISAALNNAITTSVDLNQAALELAKRNFTLNKLNSEQHTFVNANVFEYLRKSEQSYDLIVLDPPAFVKNKAGFTKGTRGYKDINRLAIKQVNHGGIILTCSCSARIDWLLFQKIVFSAAQEAGREVQIISKLSQPADHPINIYHPEGEYLKTLLLQC